MSTITDPVPVSPGQRRGTAPARPATFGDAVRSEWIKLTSVRSTWITLLVALVLGVGFGTLISYLSGSHHATGGFGHHGIWDPTSVSFRAIVIAQLAIAVLGVLVVTSEYGTGMIRVSLAVTPRRTRFLLSKALVYTAVALVVGEVMAFAAFLAGQAVIGLNAPSTTLGAPDVLRAVIGAGLYLAVIGLLASAIGALVRNTAAGISAIVALLFVLPGVVQALPSSWANPITEFWPTQAGSQVFAVVRGAHTLAAWSGFGVLVAFTILVLAVADVTLRRRDA
ncbi:MAG: ABC transporter permease [Actinomycetota bacterium]|jgi:ABC-type transport system involved in multi-copper enzyme maturation permease subunit|nr:ABC transporter permease [Actinomycetota bacterium]MDA8342141.1 ABC transporter permease [Actinomycetota bacterium]